jgi:CRAL/TRIO domain
VNLENTFPVTITLKILAKVRIVLAINLILSYNIVPLSSDDKFLLQFLRTKKYDLEKAIDLFEKYLLLKHDHPKWFDYGDNERTKFWDLFDTGFAYPLIERDEEGRRVMLLQGCKIDPKQHTFADIIRLVTYIAQTLLEEEETQIAGVCVIVDLTNLTMSHISLFPITDIISFVKIIKAAAVGRQKQIHMVNLPNFAAFFLEVAKKVMTEKLRKRIKLVKDMSEMKNEMNVSMLPQEFGGKVPQSVMMDEFRKLSRERHKLYMEINDGVDWEKLKFENDDESCSIM